MNKDARFSQKYEIFSKKSMWGGGYCKNETDKKGGRIKKYTE